MTCTLIFHTSLGFIQSDRCNYHIHMYVMKDGYGERLVKSWWNWKENQKSLNEKRIITLKNRYWSYWWKETRLLSTTYRVIHAKAYNIYVNPFVTVTHKCVAEYLNKHYLCSTNISSKFSSNSEAFASELLENLEEMLPHYSIFKTFLRDSLNPSNTGNTV